MAKISSYPQADVPLSGSDMLIGTDTVNDNETKNFTLSELAQFIDGDIGGNYVPYTGATGDVNLGTNSMTLNNLYVTGGISDGSTLGGSGQFLSSTGTSVAWVNISIPTLQQVLASGRDLINGLNFQGTNSGTSNTGNFVIGIGDGSALLNSGNNVVGMGTSASASNTGDFVIGIGSQCSQSNLGDYVVGIGRGSCLLNEGQYVIGIGEQSAYINVGNNVIAIGNSAGGNNNPHNNVNLFGAFAVATNNNQTVLAGEEYQVRLDYNGLTTNRQYNMPDADGTLVLSVNGTAPDAAGNVVVTASGGVQTVKVSLTSANILTLNNSTPFVIIPAPGVSKYINVISILYVFNFVTTPYSSVALRAGLHSSGFTVASGLSNLLNASATTSARPSIVGNSLTTSSLANNSLGLFTTLAPIGGDGTLDVYVVYNIIDL